MVNRPLSEMAGDFATKAKLLTQVIDTRIPKLVGEMLVDGFRESFDNQKFNDTGVEPWKQVKRREIGNPWYGFQWIPGGGPNYKVPAGARGSRTNGTVRKYGTRGGKTNFSPRATTRAALLGSGSVNLRDSIYLLKATRGTIVVANDQEHAQVHNEGGTAKIFGGKAFHMPRRQFMGTSDILNKRAKRLIDIAITKIL
jgi:phage gpG-like protein